MLQLFLFSFSRKGWLFNHEQCIYVLFTYPQISLFNNLFIKNEFYGTIHTFKNYFTTVFSVFSFGKISSIQTCQCQYLDDYSLPLAKIALAFFWGKQNFNPWVDCIFGFHSSWKLVIILYLECDTCKSTFLFIFYFSYSLSGSMGQSSKPLYYSSIYNWVRGIFALQILFR